MYALLSIVEGVSRTSAHCRVYVLLFSSSTVSNEDAHDELQKALVMAYVQVLKAIAHASGKLEHRTIRKALTAVIRPGETSAIVRELERCDNGVRAAAAACTAVQLGKVDRTAHEVKDQVKLGFEDFRHHASDVAADRQALGSRLDALKPDFQVIHQQISRSETEFEALRGLLTRLETPLFRLDKQVSEFLTEIKKDRKIRILDWVSKIKYGNHHKSVSDSRTPDTCGWLLEDTRFVDWQTSSSSVILVLYGSRKLRFVQLDAHSLG